MRKDCKDEKQRKNRCDNCNQCARDPRKLIPYDDRTVHGNRSRRGLRNGDQIQHFILFDPMVFIHKLLFHKRDNHISAAKRECAEIQRGEKQRPYCRWGCSAYYRPLH